MTPELRRLAFNMYLRVESLPAETRMTVRAGTIAALIRALFAEERGGAREERLDAAEKRIDEILQASPTLAWLQQVRLKRAGRRRSHRKGPTSRAKPFPSHPGVQRNLQFTEAAIPPPTSFDLPPTGEGRLVA